uniref:Uncharacterized protein n=1 Tax=Ixodes ricinus TaxID=34613 RepID=A0A6B0ULK3_IXORI
MRSMHSWLCSWLSCRSSWQRSLLRCTRLRKSSPRCSATSPSNFSTRSTAVRRRRLAPSTTSSPSISAVSCIPMAEANMSHVRGVRSGPSSHSSDRKPSAKSSLDPWVWLLTAPRLE